MSDRMPALYIGHGAPILLDDPVWSGELRDLAAGLPRPRAILIISAHWEAAPLSLSAQGVPLVYDFGGFAPKYYNEKYATPDGSDLAARLTSLMPGHETVHQHASRGLDHGAWVPLKIMYPEADIPVVQMSLPTRDPGQLMVLGQRLRELRDEAVLIIGSGFLTHGLPFLTDYSINATPPGWSVDFDQWAAEALSRGDVDALASYRTNAPGMPFAHPTVEHFTPLFVAMGAATQPDSAPDQVIDGFWMGLAKRSLVFA